MTRQIFCIKIQVNKSIQSKVMSRNVDQSSMFQGDISRYNYSEGYRTDRHLGHA